MKKKNGNRTSHNQPAWKRKNPKEIEAFRGELSILEDLSNGIRKGGKVKRKYKLKNENDITTAKERIKQKVHVKAQRIRRFEKRTKFYRQTKIFKTCEEILPGDGKTTHRNQRPSFYKRS